ncbi:hypothetical protein [Flavisolibacter tropicus]|nr:hypothetical protein [Flavisolibacter tropicus]
MKQTFIPIFILLSVMLLLFAFLYFSDPGKPVNRTRPQAKRVRIGIVDSSLKLTETAVLDSIHV